MEFESPYLIADMSVWDVDAIAGIETDTVRELSCSYHYTADMTPGVFEGQTYDGVMRNISGNHVALVQSGRAGSDVLAADSGLETNVKETKFGKAIYAILCAISPKLAKDAALKPLVIGLTPQNIRRESARTEAARDGCGDARCTDDGSDGCRQRCRRRGRQQEDDEQRKRTGQGLRLLRRQGWQQHAEGCKTAADEKAAKDKAAKDAEMKEGQGRRKRSRPRTR